MNYYTLEDMTGIITSMSDSLRGIEEQTNHLHQAVAQFKGRARDSSVALFHLSNLHAQIDAITKKIYHMKDLYDKTVVPSKMDEEGIDLLRIPELARSFSRQQRMSASMVDKEKAFEWVRSMGQDDIIQTTINASTLASFCRNLMEEQGIEPPPDAVKLNIYYATGVNKYTPKGNELVK